MRIACPAFLILLLGVAPGFAGAQAPPSAPEEVGPATGEEPDQPEVEEAEPVDLSATGDAWVDAQLADISRYGRRYRNAFVDELVRYRDAPRALVVALLDEHGWEPGEVYFACSLAAVTGRSCRFIVAQRGEPAVQGWSALAAGLGAGPDSAEFGRIKQGVVHSYTRWARPLRLDAELAEAFPGHGQPPRPEPAADGEG